MARLPVMAMAALAIVASPALCVATPTPAFAQGDDWGSSETDVSDSSLRDFLRNWIEDRGDRRDMLMDLIQERRDQRGERRDLLQERTDGGSELMDLLRNHPGLRERLRERLASRWRTEEDGGGWRGRLRERLAERSGGNCYFLTRSLRDQEGSLLVIVRRRVCRD